METWVPPWARAPASGPRGRTSLDVPPNGAKPSVDGDVPTPRLALGCGVEPVTGGVVLDDSHPPTAMYTHHDHAAYSYAVC